jgi:hypothetical protein
MKKLVNFCLSIDTLGALRASVENKQRSGFIRRAINGYLELPRQPVKNQRQPDSEPELEQVAVLLEQNCLDKLRQIYPDVPSSVVIETAIIHALNSSA